MQVVPRLSQLVALLPSLAKLVHYVLQATTFPRGRGNCGAKAGPQNIVRFVVSKVY